MPFDPTTPNLGLFIPLHGTHLNDWEVPVNANMLKIDDFSSGSGPYDIVAGPGHPHDGGVGRGPKIRHQDLTGGGTVSHADLDANYGKSKVSGNDATIKYLEDKLVAGANVVLTTLNDGGDEQLEIAVPAVPASFGDVNDPSGEYGWKHFVPTSAPVAYTDNFNYPPGYDLKDAGYVVQSMTNVSGLGFKFFTTGYSAMAVVDGNAGAGVYPPVSPVQGKYAAAVVCHIPHGPAQRVTLSITKLDRTHLYPGDFVAFTLAVFSTHQLGPRMPQKIGVILEIHYTCTAIGVFKMTHQIVVEDGANQHPVWSCSAIHLDPNDILGCWELSLDNNGHVYHYWRRQLVYSSQTSPPNIPGPIKTYFPTMTAALTGSVPAEPKYGAMGFGCQYRISSDSKFDFEFRWLSVTSDEDIYDEVPPACPGTATPWGIPTVVPLDLEYFFVPPADGDKGVPGVLCCDPPFLPVAVGDQLASGDFVTACDRIHTDVYEGPAYQTSASTPWGYPCEPPSGTPVLISPPETWPVEGETTYVIVTGVKPLPPEMVATTTTPGIDILEADSMSPEEFMLKVRIDDGLAGTPFDVKLTSFVKPAINYTMLNFATVQERLPEIDSVTWLDIYQYFYTVPVANYRFQVSVLGKGFNPDATLTTTVPVGVTIHSFSYVNPGQIDADIEFSYDMCNLPFDLVVTNVAQGETATYNGTVSPVGPLVAYVTLDSAEFSPPGRNGKVYGNNFVVGPPDTSVMTIISAGALLTGHTITSTTLIDFSMNVVGPATTVVVGRITNPGTGLSIDFPICVVGDIDPPVPLAVTYQLDGTGSVTPPLYENKRRHKYKATVSGNPAKDFGGAVYARLPVGPVGPIYAVPRDVHVTGRSATKFDFEFWLDCGSPGLPAIEVMKPGTGTAMIAGPAILTPPVLTLNVGDLVFSGGLRPGATGTVTITPTAGFTYLTEIWRLLDLAGDVSSDITFTNKVIGVGSVQYDYAVSASAVEGTVYGLNAYNGLCDPAPAAYMLTIEAPLPVITSVEFITPFENQPLNEGHIYGSGFKTPGEALLIGGPMIEVSHNVVSPTQIDLIVANGPASPPPATIQVQNPSGDLSNIVNYSVQAEPVPLVRHAEFIPALVGPAIARISGIGLKPGGATWTFSPSFIPAGPPSPATDTYLEFAGLIVGPPLAPITLTIASTTVPGGYPPVQVGIVEPPLGGVVQIDSIGPTLIPEGSASFSVNLTGSNFGQIATVEATAFDPDRQNVKYDPIGPDTAVAVVIASKTENAMTLTLTVGRGLTPNKYTLTFYDAMMVPLTSLAQILEITPETDTPVINAAERLGLDAFFVGPPDMRAINSNWTVMFAVSGTTPYVLGDYIQAIGFTLLSAVYNPGTLTWTVQGKNGPVAGTHFQMAVVRSSVPPPLNPPKAVYRFQGGDLI